MTDHQVIATADMLVDEFPFMKIADIIFIFKQAKMGLFGPLYEGLDGAKIITWFHQVWNDKLDVAEADSDREHDIMKSRYKTILGEARSSGDNNLRTLLKRTEGWKEFEKSGIEYKKPE